jgi:glycosyltransferase involved in cell wall biosynthesis
MECCVKVALLCWYPLHKRPGGSGVHTTKLVQYLSAIQDIDLHVVTFGDKEHVESKNFTLHVLPENRYLRYLPVLGYLLKALQLKRVVRRLDPDIVHALSTYYPYSTAAVLLDGAYPRLLTAFGISSVEMEHDNLSFTSRIDGIFFVRPHEKFVLKHSPHIHVQSPYVKRLIAEITDSRICVIPEGIDANHIKPSQSLPISEDIDIFIAVRLRRLKGIDVLIKAAAQVVERLPELKICIAGSGTEEDRLKDLVTQLKLKDNVSFLGYVFDERLINSYYDACKIVVVPSRWDIEPFAPLNAGVSGKPAIISDSSNSSVIIDGKTGFIFQSENVGELSDKMITLLTDDDLRHRMGKAANERVRAYDWNTIAQRYVAIYREIVKSHENAA